MTQIERINTDFFICLVRVICVLIENQDIHNSLQAYPISTTVIA